MKNTYIFIDGSYFCFYKYYSLLNWWKLSHPDELGVLENPIQNEIIVEKFKKTFVDLLHDLPKKLNLDKDLNPILYVGKDCPRKNIWRNDFIQEKKMDMEYKANRKNGVEDGFMGGAFFKMVYDEELFLKGGVKNILSHPKLEADDCIAISVKYILDKYPESKIYIITSDKDYLQLCEPRVELYNLHFKKLSDQKSSSGNADCDLFCKIVMGDISDNIKPVLKKCGPKTALKYYQNKDLFENALKKENAYELYELNKKLVDFNEIPENYVEELKEILDKEFL